jgi:hypothetical protein
MYGRWMFERASSVVCSRSTSLRREVTWLARVPAEKRAMKSLSWAIFFSRCAFPDSEVRYQGCSGSFPNPEADRLSQLSTSTHNKCEQM